MDVIANTLAYTELVFCSVLLFRINKISEILKGKRVYSNTHTP